MIKYHMEKKTIGIFLIIFSMALAGFTAWVTADLKKLNQFLHQSCTLPEDICPFNTLVPPESIIGFLLSAVIGGFGVILLILGRKEKRLKVLDTKKIEQTVSQLGGDEKQVYDAIVASDGAIFQSELVEKSGLDKVKVSRVLDRLEGKGLIERKRRGMSNVIVLRH